MGQAYSVHVSSQAAVTSPQSEDGCLLLSCEGLHFIFWVRAVFVLKPSLEGVPDEGFAFPIGDGLFMLLLSTSFLCKSVSLFVPCQATVSRDPLYSYLRVLTELAE